MLQVFDSWAGELSPHLFDKFCLPFITQIRQEVRKGLEKEQLEQVPMIIFAKGRKPFLAVAKERLLLIAFY